MSNFCKNCGAQLKPETKFCASCGTKTQEAETSSVKTVRTISEDIVPEVTKSRILPKKLLFSAVAVVLVIALGVAILPRLGKEAANTEGTTGDLSAFTYTERDYAAKSKELKVSPESPSASAHGVTITFGEYALAGDETLTIRQLPDKQALVIAENARPIIARLHRCIEGRDGRRLLGQQRALREKLAAGREGDRDVEARTAAALVEAQRHGW